MPRNREDIASDLKRHHAAGGCANECCVEDWYREWYRLPPDTETVLETVERWANDVVQERKPLTRPG